MVSIPSCMESEEMTVDEKSTWCRETAIYGRFAKDEAGNAIAMWFDHLGRFIQVFHVDEDGNWMTSIGELHINGVPADVAFETVWIE